MSVCLTYILEVAWVLNKVHYDISGSDVMLSVMKNSTTTSLAVCQSNILNCKEFCSYIFHTAPKKEMVTLLF